MPHAALPEEDELPQTELPFVELDRRVSAEMLMVVLRHVEARIAPLEKRIVTLTESITLYLDSSKTLMRGFPDENPDKHRAAHEAWIEESEARKEFWRELKLGLVKYGLIGFGGWFAIKVIWPALVAALLKGQV